MDTQTQSSPPPFYARWTNIPFAPAKCPFFYGWVIVAVATLSIVFSTPGQTAGIGVFTDHLMVALKINRQQLSLVYMIGTIASGLILPFAGKLLDRIGIRLMSIFASLGLAISLIVLSNVEIINNLLARFIKFTYLPLVVAAFAFLLVRFFGQGNMTMIGRVAMGRWFNHWRGIATAISGVPVAFAFNAAPWILNEIIINFGWRQACWLMAIIIGVGMTTVGLLFFRDKPEDCGLEMDGITKEKRQKKPRPQLHPTNREFTRAEAIRNISFWAFALGLAIHGLIITAVAFHITSIGEEMGKTRNQAVIVFLFSSFISIPVRFIVSYIVDNTRLQLKWVLTALTITTFLNLLSFAYLYTNIGWFSAIITLGLTGGIWGVLCNVAFPRYFGRKHLGAISGISMSILVISSAVGPAMFSYGKLWFGSYQNVALLVLIMPASIFIMSFFTKNPQEN